MSKIELMIVEDSPQLCKVYSYLLTHNGYLVSNIAHNGIEAIEYYKSVTTKYPDIIVMDYRLPLKDGIDTSREILEINPDQKIIFFTADKKVQEQVKQELGITNFRSKPLELKGLLEEIDIILRSDGN